VNRLAAAQMSVEHLDSGTHNVIARERKLREKGNRHRNPSEHLRQAFSSVVHKLRSRKHYRDHINVTAKEHMSTVDCFDGAKIRKLDDGQDDGQDEKSSVHGKGLNADKDLLVVHPYVDGRLKDVARPNV